ncbi:hypothetical protein DMENIID0001_091020 [Sergentomyia squamirostris]
MLVEIIVEYAIAKNIELSCKNMALISEEIVEVFPTEEMETYYSPKITKTKKCYGGMLYCRYHNSKRRVSRLAAKKNRKHVRRGQEAEEGSDIQEEAFDIFQLSESDNTGMYPDVPYDSASEVSAENQN